MPADRPNSSGIVIVSGLPRSGTSLMMAMLRAGGLELLTDGLREADEDNPNGYYEYEPVKRLESGDDAWIDLASGKAVKVVSALLEYLPSNRTYHVVFMNRRLEEIVASQDKMLVRRGQAAGRSDLDHMTKLLQRHLDRVRSWLRSQANIRCLEVDYNELVHEPLPQISEINRFLECRLDMQAMIDVVQPDLYRNRA